MFKNLRLPWHQKDEPEPVEADTAKAEPETVTRTFPQFFQHVRKLGFDPAVCIDVGAANGTPSIYEAFPTALHVVFEPLTEFQAALKDALTPYQHVIHQCALMETSGSMTIKKHADLFGSSLMHSRKDDEDDIVEVPVSTLDEQMKGTDLSGKVLLKTDCQGADLSVIKGGLNTLPDCDLVILEASLYRFWGGHHPDFYDIVQFMKQQGFVVYDFLDGLFRPYDRALGQIDIAFTRENGDLRRHSRW